MKPIPTTLAPQQSVDLRTGEAVQTQYERSDFCPVPRAVIILEAAVAFVLADALLSKLGGDSLAEMLPRFARRCAKPGWRTWQSMGLSTFSGLMRKSMPETAPPDALVFLYGPPGSGKSTLGRLLAQALARPFIDLDGEIESRSGVAITEIFNTEGEPGFRRRERLACLLEVLDRRPAVIALGGGALLDEANRARGGSSRRRPVPQRRLPELLLQRTRQAAGSRPLLGSRESLAEHLAALLQQRSGHYASFPRQLDTSLLSPDAAAWQAQISLGIFRVSGMGSGYEAVVQPGALNHLGPALQQAALRGPLALVTDEHVAPHYLPRASAVLAQAGYAVFPVELPPGKHTKLSAP